MVPRNGQVLLVMSDTVALKIINVNTDSIEAVNTQKENCNTNISDAKNQTSGRKLMWQRRAVQTWMKI